jgi:nucleoside-diphosphate-sugar epimerase
MHVLLTGGSGFIAHHILKILLERGHTVTTTVRSPSKADLVRSSTPQATPSNLHIALVPDIAIPNAFDETIRTASPPFNAVIHTASPFTFSVTDFKKELLDPAIIGTTGILASIARYGPDVKHVVITSSFAAIIDANKGLAPGYVYSEKDWNPITEEEALKSASAGYRGSKTFAERAAWEFVEREKPGFGLTTMNPPLVLGPIESGLQGLDWLNTSNQRIRDVVVGKAREGVMETGTFLWVDVRVSGCRCDDEMG